MMEPEYKIQFLDDIDPFNCSGILQPSIPASYAFKHDIPLLNQLPHIHDLLDAPHTIEDSGLQLSHNLHYLYLDASIGEQSELLDGFNVDEHVIVLRTELSVTVDKIIAKLLNTTGCELNKNLKSLKTMFQSDHDLVYEFVTNKDGLDCLISVGTSANCDIQSSILRTIGDILLYMDGMNGIIEKKDTVLWFCKLLSSESHIIQKTSLKLLIAFIQYNDSNYLLVLQALKRVVEGTNDLIMNVVIRILNETKETADTDLCLHAMVFLNKLLHAITDRNMFYDVVDALEENGMDEIITGLLSFQPKNTSLVEQCHLYETAIKVEDESNEENQGTCEDISMPLKETESVETHIDVADSKSLWPDISFKDPVDKNSAFVELRNGKEGKEDNTMTIDARIPRASVKTAIAKSEIVGVIQPAQAGVTEIVKECESNKTMILGEYDFTDLTEEDDYDTAVRPIPAVSNAGGPPPPPPPPPMPPPPPPPGGHHVNKPEYVHLFWTEVKLTHGMDKSIWNCLQPVEVDKMKIGQLFENRSKTPTKHVDNNKSKEIAVLDLSRAQTIGILLKGFPPVQVLTKSILEMDSRLVDKETLEKLIHILEKITDEEKKMIQDAHSQHPDTPLAPAESFLLEMWSISELSIRLELWSFFMDYNNKEKDICAALSDLKESVGEIKSSETLNIILAYVLEIGNFLNEGNIKAFDLAYLTKLNDVKDTVHHQTLLYHLCAIIMENHPGTSDLYCDFDNLHKASKQDYEAIHASITTLEDACKKSTADLNLIAKHNCSLDLKSRLTKFISDTAERIEILKVVDKRVNNRYKTLLQYLGVDSSEAKTTKPQEFCGMISAFSLAYKVLYERAVEMKKRSEHIRKRQKTRGKRIIGGLWKNVTEMIISLQNEFKFSGIVPNKDNKIEATEASRNTNGDDRDDDIMNVLTKFVLDGENKVRKRKPLANDFQARRSRRRSRALGLLT